MLNTLKSILQYEMGYTCSLHFINRIDRLTSGIVILAKTKESAQRKLLEMTQRQIQKRYLCRVWGDFPDALECHEPLKIVAHRLGLTHVSKEGKECKTSFKKLSFNGRTSLVEAVPFTGRTHQIRVHLQYLGYPIANDPLYASNIWNDFNRGKGGLSREEMTVVTGLLADSLAKQVNALPDVDGCVECLFSKPDPHPDELLIWLHSIEYVGPTWRYQTPEPFWAAPDFDGDKQVRFADLEE